MEFLAAVLTLAFIFVCFALGLFVLMLALNMRNERLNK